MATTVTVTAKATVVGYPYSTSTDGAGQLLLDTTYVLSTNTTGHIGERRIDVTTVQAGAANFGFSFNFRMYMLLVPTAEVLASSKQGQNYRLSASTSQAGIILSATAPSVIGINDIVQLYTTQGTTFQMYGVHA